MDTNPQRPDRQKSENDGNDPLNPSQKGYKSSFSPEALKQSNAQDSVSDLEDQFTKQRSGSKDITSKEQQPEWLDATTGEAKKQSITGKAKNKAKIAALGLVVSLLSAVLVFFALLPVKLLSVVSNLTEKAAVVTEAAIEKRSNYIVQYYLASKISVRLTSDVGGGQKPICATGIACNLFKNWQANNFESKLGITIDTNTKTLYTSATSWKISFDGVENNPDAINGKLTEEFKNSREARQFLTKQIKDKTKWNNVYKRYAMRKMLMKRYGIRSWRGPEKVEDKFENFAKKKEALERSIKKALVKNTIGRVNPNNGEYLSCMIDGKEGCDKFRKRNNSTKIEGNPKVENQAIAEDDSDADKAKKEFNNQAAASLAESAESGSVEFADSEIDEVIDTVDGGGSNAEVSKAVGKVVTKQLLAKLGAGVGIAFALAKIVESVDSGGVNKIIEDRANLAYIGYSTEYLTIVDKLKTGDLDADTLQAASEIAGDPTTSPLYHEEQIKNSGSYTASIFGSTAELGTAENRVVRACGDSQNGETTTLAPGQFVCDDKQFVKNKTQFTESWWWDDILVPVSKAVTDAFEWFFDLVDFLATATGLNALVEGFLNATGLSGLIASAVEGVMNYFFGIPINGTETDGDWYDAMSGGTKASSNALMKDGVDEEYKSMGGGGTPLSSVQVAAIYQEDAVQKNYEFQSQTLMARIFDPNLTRSLVSQAAITMPTSISSVLTTSPLAFITHLGTASASAANIEVKDYFGLKNIYGYATDDPIFQASPESYKEETCKTSADLREASWRNPGEEGGGTTDTNPVGMYTQKDPCALEKLSVAGLGAVTGGSGLDEDFKIEGESASTNPSTATGADVTPVSQDGTGVQIDDSGLNIVFTNSFPDKTAAIPQVKNIVIHWLVSNPHSAPDITNAFSGNGTSVQFYVDSDGVINQLTPFANSIASHARAANDHAIGIEIGSLDGSYPMDEIEANLNQNTIQKAAVIKLTTALAKKFGVQNIVVNDSILSHSVDCAKNGDGVKCSSAEESSKIGIVGHYQIQSNKSDPGKDYIKQIQQGVAGSL